MAIDNLDSIPIFIDLDEQEIKDVSEDYTLLAVQGPDSKEVVSSLTDENLNELAYYSFRIGRVADRECIISRTGYTGEDGFEIYINRPDSGHIWNAVLAAGQKHDIRPVGLGARDSLRLESAYCLYGNDIDPSTNPIEAGLGWIVKLKKKGGFIGKDSVIKAKENVKRKLVGFKLMDKGVPRQHCEIYHEGQRIGVVTSGGMSPVLEVGIGMAYIDLPLQEIGTQIEVDVRGRKLKAEVVKTPLSPKVIIVSADCIIAPSPLSFDALILIEPLAFILIFASLCKLKSPSVLKLIPPTPE